MKPQRVNFFQTRFQRPKRRGVLAVHAALFLGVLVVVLLVVSVLRHNRLTVARAAWQRQEEARRTVAHEGARSRRVTACQSALQDLFRSDAWHNAAPLAPMLEQLARVHVAGIWLTEIDIAQAGGTIRIGGEVLRGRLKQFPPFVRRLVQQEMFAGYRVQGVQWNQGKSAAATTLPRTSAASPDEEGGEPLHFAVVAEKQKGGGVPP